MCIASLAQTEVVHRWFTILLCISLLCEPHQKPPTNPAQHEIRFSMLRQKVMSLSNLILLLSHVEGLKHYKLSMEAKLLPENL